MTKVLDAAVLARAARDAERALAAGDRDTLAGRFNPMPLPQVAESQKRKRR